MRRRRDIQKVIKKLKKILYKIQMYDFVSDQFANCALDKEALMKDLEDTKKDWERLQVRNIDLANQIQRYKLKRPSASNAKAWNDRWQKSKIFYKAPKRKEVQEYVRYRPITLISHLADILIKRNKLHSDNVDVVPLNVLRWLDGKFRKKEFRYKVDNKETWYSPEEILQKKVGDCDDYGILEYYLIREIFKKLGCWKKVRHRLKAVVGHVHNTDKMNSYAGLHFYLCWLHTDKEFYTVESTFHRPRSILNFGKKPQKFNDQYGLVVWTFNEEFCWAQKSMSVSSLDFGKV